MKATGRFLELDSLRGIAAVSVVFFHFTTGYPIADYGFKFGRTGVDLFFLISGFVIFLTIEKTKNYRDFLWSRFARLFPTYWACVTITAIAILSWELIVKAPMTFPRWSDYLLNLTMIQYLFNVPNIDGVYWTLSIELCFYLFVLIIYLLKKVNQIEIIGYFVVAICLINQVYLAFVFPGLNGFLQFFFPIVNYFSLFIAGIMFYKIKFEQINLSRGLLVVLCLITQMLASVSYIEVLTRACYCFIILFYFAVFLLYVYGYLRFIVNKVTLFFGKISYSLYLIHQYIACYILIPFLAHSRHFHLNSNIVFFCIVFPFVVLLATLINKYVELPTMKYLKNRQSDFRKTK